MEAAEPSLTVAWIATLVKLGATLATEMVFDDDPTRPDEPVIVTTTGNAPGRPYLWLGPLQVVPLITPAWGPRLSP
ncbi:MAG TPA: hypothetical protein VIK06_02540 [Candidatus Limnocylindrales bacterium]